MAVHVMFLSSCVSSQHLSPLDVVNGSKEVAVVYEDSVVEDSELLLMLLHWAFLDSGWVWK